MPAGRRAALTMIHFVPGAFRATGFANLRANRTNPDGKIGVPGHFSCCQGTDIRATSVEFDAADHHFDILFFQTRGSALFAGDDASMTGLDTSLVFFVFHRVWFSRLMVARCLREAIECGGGDRSFRKSSYASPAGLGVGAHPHSRCARAPVRGKFPSYKPAPRGRIELLSVDV